MICVTRIWILLTSQARCEIDVGNREPLNHTWSIYLRNFRIWTWKDRNARKYSMYVGVRHIHNSSNGSSSRSTPFLETQCVRRLISRLGYLIPMHLIHIVQMCLNLFKNINLFIYSIIRVSMCCYRFVFILQERDKSVQINVQINVIIINVINTLGFKRLLNRSLSL